MDDRYHDMAELTVENAETAAQLEIKDDVLREALILNFIQTIEQIKKYCGYYD